MEATNSNVRPSTLALAVLSLLGVGPLHPYGMQRLMKQWGKDDVVNVGQRANLYKTIKRLLDAGLIAVRQTERDQLYPERTVYELTDAGRHEAVVWVTDMLGTPRNEFPVFPAALSFAMLLSPDELRSALERRAADMRERLTEIEQTIETYSASLPKISLLDDKYQRTMVAAELAWIDGVVADLRAGDLTWGDDLAQIASSYMTE